VVQESEGASSGAVDPEVPQAPVAETGDAQDVQETGSASRSTDEL
jgi:hypothetical protein